MLKFHYELGHSHWKPLPLENGCAMAAVTGGWSKTHDDNRRPIFVWFLCHLVRWISQLISHSRNLMFHNKINNWSGIWLSGSATTHRTGLLFHERGFETGWDRGWL